MKSLQVIDHGNSNTNKNTTQNEALLKDNNFSTLFNIYFFLPLVTWYSLSITADLEYVIAGYEMSNLNYRSAQSEVLFRVWQNILKISVKVFLFLVKLENKSLQL